MAPPRVTQVGGAAGPNQRAGALQWRGTSRGPPVGVAAARQPPAGNGAWQPPRPASTAHGRATPGPADPRGPGPETPPSLPVHTDTAGPCLTACAPPSPWRRHRRRRRAGQMPLAPPVCPWWQCPGPKRAMPVASAPHKPSAALPPPPREPPGSPGVCNAACLGRASRPSL